MNISMLTWNVDWLRNGMRSGAPKEYLECDRSSSVYTQIINNVKNYIDANENAIAFLHEFPYKDITDMNGRRWKWEECLFFQKLKEDFPVGKYHVLYNDRDARRLSLAIFKSGEFCENKIPSLKHNRIISAKKDGLVMIGVHMPTGFKRNDADDKLWIALINYVETCNLPIAVLGDFNAYVGCDEKLTERRYLEMLNITNDVVPENAITYIGNTVIDHILIKNVVENRLATVEKEFELSDHKYVTYSMNV